MAYLPFLPFRFCSLKCFQRIFRNSSLKMIKGLFLTLFSYQGSFCTGLTSNFDSLACLSTFVNCFFTFFCRSGCFFVTIQPSMIFVQNTVSSLLVNGILGRKSYLAFSQMNNFRRKLWMLAEFIQDSSARLNCYVLFPSLTASKGYHFDFCLSTPFLSFFDIFLPSLHFRLLCAFA